MTDNLIIDGMNFLHRARSGFTGGENPVVYNFFRNLRAQVEFHSPGRVIFVLEGRPKHRTDVLPSYKENRKVDPTDTVKVDELAKFFRQVDKIVGMLASHFPVSVVRHPDLECDDVVYNLIESSARSVEWTVASNDSDFTQLLCEYENVKLFNPMKKMFVYAPQYDYVMWKALRGDASDNIPGIPGVGDAEAQRLVEDTSALRRFLADEGALKQFNMNYDLIKFKRWTEDEAMLMESSAPTKDWDAVRTEFDSMGFASIINPKSWERFTSTFDELW